MEDIISKVKKLLALSTSSNANEAAAATAAANKLLDKYRLSMADIEDDSADDNIYKDSTYIYETGRITEWKRQLAHLLSKHYGCAIYNHIDPSSARKKSRYRLVGRIGDLEITRYMFTWLVNECQRISDIEAKGKGKIFANSYCMGFVAGVYEKLQSSRIEAKQDASSTSIAKIDSRYQESREKMYEFFPNMKTVSNSNLSRIDGNAFFSGKEKGKSIHLGASLPGKEVKMLGA